MRRWLLVVVPLLVLGGLINWRLKAKRAETVGQEQARKRRASAPVAVTLASAVVRPIVRTFTTVGTVEPASDVRIAPKVTGRLDFLAVREGERVSQGQVLARIDPSEILAQVRQQQALVAEAQYRLAQARVVQGATNVGVVTNIRQQIAGLNSAKADYNQARQNRNAQIVATQAAVTDTAGRVNNGIAALNSTQADANQVRENYHAQVAAAQAAVADVQGRVSNVDAAAGVAQAAISSAEAKVENARTKFNRATYLYKNNAGPRQDVDDTAANLKVEEAGLESARQQLQGTVAQRTSALAQKQAAEQQASIVQTKGLADIQAAEAKVKQAQAVIDSARAQEKVAQQQVSITINKSLADIDAAQAKVAQSQAGVQLAQANTAQGPAYQENLSALRAAVAAAQGLLRNTQAQLSSTVLTSPINGVVTRRYMDPGSLATPTQPVLSIEAIRQVWVTIPIPEEVSRHVVSGQLIQVVFDAMPGRRFTSRVVEINPAADPQSRQFTIRAILDNAGGLVKPGMFARVTLETMRIAMALVVPREAVQQTAGGATVEVVDAGGKAHSRKVTTGESDDQGIAITSGLQQGDKVVTLSGAPLKEGQTVRAGGGKKRPGGKGPDAAQPAGAAA